MERSSVSAVNQDAGQMAAADRHRRGQLFDVIRNKSSVAARLECSMADGDQRIFPIVGDANPSPNIVFVSKNSADPMLDILTYRVTQ